GNACGIIDIKFGRVGCEFRINRNQMVKIDAPSDPECSAHGVACNISGGHVPIGIEIFFNGKDKVLLERTHLMIQLESEGISYREYFSGFEAGKQIPRVNRTAQKVKS